MTLFIRLLDVEASAKADLLRDLVIEGGTRIFEVDPSSFALVPGSPFSYWVGEGVLSLFQRMPSLQRDGRIACAGAVTNDNSRFVRLNWEVEERNSFVPFAKGGKFSPFYYDIELRVSWRDEGRELKAFICAFREAHGWSPHWAAELHNAQHYFRPGLTWPLRTTSGLGVRVLPSGCIFGHKGPAVFVEANSTDKLLALCAVMNSAPFKYLVAVQVAAADAAARSYEVGVIQNTPVPTLAATECIALSRLAQRAWSLKRTLDSVVETSNAFLLPVPLRISLGPYDPLSIEAELAKIRHAIDDLTFGAYGLEGNDRENIEAWVSQTLGLDNVDGEVTGEKDEVEDADEVLPADDTATLYSWVVGVVFGRFDIRLATGKRQASPEPAPFDPLPTRSPGVIPESDKAQFPARPLLVDDRGHSLDLAAKAGAVLEQVGFATINPESFRRWLTRDFFSLHIKMYSKSSRKAPIYWQLATPSASYSVWLYIHAFSRDTLYQVQEIAGTKLLHEERKLESLRADLGPNPTAAARKALATQETLIEELRAFLEEVNRVAPLWNPNLDDGVVLNFAPLWRLVPHHKPWQKELKEKWDELCAGKYDWAHLAMHLWPERVVPKCATDRSLAIAHGLEEVFWMEGEDGKWRPRPIPARSIEELIAERTSPAVQAALKDLLEAPTVLSGGRRGRPRGRRGAAGEMA